MLKKFYYSGLYYSCDEYGNIYGSKSNKPLKQRENKDGYLQVTLGNKNRTAVKVHRIVAELFVYGKESGLEVNHIDFNRKNNYYKNLEWVTHKENVEKSSNVGRYKCKNGELNGRAILSSFDVEKILKEYEKNKNIAEISRLFNISYSQASRIVKRQSWKHITSY